MAVHLDTDLGGDPDDACALAMLLGWPGVEITGITTTIDPGGQRAACVEYCLALAGRDDIPVVAGAERSMTTQRIVEPHLGERYWPSKPSPRPAPAGASLELLESSIDQGATVIAIGPYTNLAQLENARPGSLRRTAVVVMGGCTRTPAMGLPPWGPERDWNVQWDTRAAEVVAATAARLTLVPLETTVKAHLRTAELPRLTAAGPIGQLLARQSEAYAHDRGIRELAAAHSGLPDDLVNFHHDPLACAVAVGWSGIDTREEPLGSGFQAEVFRWRPERSGRQTRVVVDLDREAFSEVWLTAVETTQRTRLA